MNKLLVILLCLLATTSSAQVKKVAPPSYFGLQVRTVFPTQFIGTNTLNLEKDGFFSTISQRVGYSFGGTVRAGLTDLIAFETGINFTQRYYDVNFSVPDSNVSGTSEFGFIEYDIPLKALIYIRLSEKWYSTASMGFAISFKPTNVQIFEQPFGPHRFVYTGLLRRKYSIDAMASFGFEYRTDRKGFFFIGGSARVPFSPIFDLVASYEWQGLSTRTFGEMDGSFLSIDVKYFFPNIRNRGPQFLDGPIE